MSEPLKGLLQPAILGVFKSMTSGASPDATATNKDPISAQDILAEKLAEAIAVSVQQYLLTQVTVIPGQVVPTTGGPTSQVGATTTPGKLNAP